MSPIDRNEGVEADAQPVRRHPLVVTAEMPPDVLAWADGLRRAHFPPDRNQLRAHVTLFHALPPSAKDEVRQILAELAAAPPPHACISGLMKLGGGTALSIDCAAIVELHGMIAERMHGMLTRQDAQPLRLHVTIQNKVKPEVARQLQEELAVSLEARSFRFYGLGLYAYEDGPWRAIRTYAFRG